MKDLIWKWRRSAQRHYCFLALFAAKTRINFDRLWKSSLRQVGAGVNILAFLLVYSASPANALAPGDSVPSILGDWWYSATGCINFDFTSGDEIAVATAAVAFYFEYYTHSTEWTFVKVDPWPTPERRGYGPCGSDTQYFPGFNNRGNEVVNLTTLTVRAPTGELVNSGEMLRRRRTDTCPPGTIDTQYSCIIGVTAYLPGDNTPPLSCSNPSAGNPIVVSNGTKFEQLNDIQSGTAGGLNFGFTYNNSNSLAASPWRHSFQKELKIIDPTKALNVRVKSDVYTTKRDACVAGWNAMRPTITDAWATDSFARLERESCQIVQNGKVVRNLLFYAPGVTVPGSIQLSRDDGSVVSYEYFGGSDFRALGNHQGKLTLNGPDSWQFTTPAGDIEDYRADGKLVGVARNGKKHAFTYNATTGLLEKVTDSAGHQLNFSYLNDRLSSVILNGAQTTSYHYNDAGLVNRVTHPNNTSRLYHYEDVRFRKALTGITDERGVRYATWKYDAQGRAISSEHAGGAEKTTLDFNIDGSTTVTNALGKKTKYLFENILGVKRVKTVLGEPTANCVGVNQSYTYNDEGFVDTQTDWNGNITKFGYDGFGREILRTQAFGAIDATTTETCWHATLNQPSRIIKLTSVILYDYWPNGQLKSTTTKPRPQVGDICNAQFN